MDQKLSKCSHFYRKLILSFVKTKVQTGLIELKNADLFDARMKSRWNFLPHYNKALLDVLVMPAIGRNFFVFTLKVIINEIP